MRFLTSNGGPQPRISGPSFSWPPFYPANLGSRSQESENPGISLFPSPPTPLSSAPGTPLLWGKKIVSNSVMGGGGQNLQRTEKIFKRLRTGEVGR